LHGNSFQQSAKEAFHMLYKKKALSKSNGAGQNEHVRHTPPFLEYQMNEIHLDIIISFCEPLSTKLVHIP